MRKLPVIFLLYINIIFKPFDMNVTWECGQTTI